MCENAKWIQCSGDLPSNHSNNNNSNNNSNNGDNNTIVVLITSETISIIMMAFCDSLRGFVQMGHGGRSSHTTAGAFTYQCAITSADYRNNDFYFAFLFSCSC